MGSEMCIRDSDERFAPYFVNQASADPMDLLGAAYSGLNGFLLLRIDGCWECWHHVEVIDCRVLTVLVGEAVAIFNGGQFHFVNLGNEIVQLLTDSIISRKKARRVQQGINGRVEFRPGLFQESRIVKLGAFIEMPPRLRNDGSNFVRRRRRRLRQS